MAPCVNQHTAHCPKIQYDSHLWYPMIHPMIHLTYTLSYTHLWFMVHTDDTVWYTYTAHDYSMIRTACTSRLWVHCISNKHINQEGRQLRVNQQCPFDLCGLGLECLQNLIGALEYLIAIQLEWLIWSDWPTRSHLDLNDPKLWPLSPKLADSHFDLTHPRPS